MEEDAGLGNGGLGRLAGKHLFTVVFNVFVTLTVDINDDVMGELLNALSSASCGFQLVSWTPWLPWVWLPMVMVFAMNLVSSIKR